MLINNLLLADDVFTLKSGDYNDPCVWSSNSVPTTGDNITINHDLNFYSQLYFYINNVTISTGVVMCGNSNIIVDNACNINVYGTLRANSISLYSNLFIHGQLTTSQFTIPQGNGSLQMVGSGFFNLSSYYCNPIPNFTSLPEITICEGDSVLIFDSYRSIGGSYWDTIANSGACDDYVLQELIVQSFNDTIDASICQGNSYLFGDESLDSSGLYTTVFSSVYGCDSIITLDLTITYPETYYDCNGTCINDSDGDMVCDELEILGCMDMMACNYDNSATDDDNLCVFQEEGYDCDGMCINDSDGDMVCDEFEVVGCMDTVACNYDASATDNNINSCEFPEYYDCNGICINDSDGDMVCDEFEVLGCIDTVACNYNNSATDDDGSCTFAETYYDCNGICINDSDGDMVCDELEILGCMNMMACNFDNSATDDDGSCTFAETFYDCNGICINDSDGDMVCDEEDNCDDESNFDQSDIDNDGEGDACDYDDGIGVEELEVEIPQLIKMIDILGREQQEHMRGRLLLYIYDNGNVEKKIIH